MTYDEAIEWLLSFADFERSGRFQDRPDVAPMLALLERLGNPHVEPSRYTIHIAGSKGKGSVAAMIESVLRADGRETGLYTSPHLYSYTERIQVNGKPVSEESFSALADEVRAAVDGASASLGDRSFVTFDLLTAMAFLAYAHAEIDVQVIEVGLGGKVDSTNVFDTKDVAVITPISFEHTAILGDTIREIAREKAAIITPGCTIVIAPQQYSDAEEVIREFAAETDDDKLVKYLESDDAGLAVHVAREYRWHKVSHNVYGQTIRIEGPFGTLEVKLPLLGAHQVENAATATASVRAFDREVSTGTIADGLANVRWPCRIEVLREDPLVIADGAHNRDSARRLAETLVEYFACDRALFVIGCGSDKDIDGLAEELAPLASRVLAVRAEHPRAMDPQRIAEAFGRLNADSEIVDKVPDAVDRAIAAAGSRALICVAGSLFVAAEARACVLGFGHVS
jgi:dihydrofolate synthase / folylpolyglutamate synthase